MSRIILHTEIKAPCTIVFDLARSIDLHKESMSNSQEEAIAGRASGLIELNESVTWRAIHLGVRQTLTSKITEFNSPFFFVDEMQKGSFKSMRHEHHFKEENGVTIMTDIFDFESPLGLLGKFFNFIYLKKYMTKLLVERNQIIKRNSENK